MRAGRVIGWVAAAIIVLGSLVMLSALQRKLEAMRSDRTAPAAGRERGARTPWRAATPMGDQAPSAEAGASGASGPSGPAGASGAGNGLRKGIPPGAIW